MHNQLNITAALIANSIAMVVLFTTFATQSWRAKDRTKNDKSLVIIAVAAFISCILDSISYYFDGKPGTLSYITVYASNWLLFVSDLIIGPFWFLFVANYIGVKLNKTHKIAVFSLNALGFVFLIANFFTPVVFTVNSDNVYSREPFFWYFMIFQGCILIDSLVYYYLAKNKSGMLKFFPVWAFLLPVAIGMAIQAFVYGVSTVYPFIAVSISTLITSLQNELVFRDKLTGLYNRYFLSHIANKADSKRPRKMTSIMLDINNFKAINEKHGHKLGDEALIDASRILVESVGSMGEVIRYSGDEFVILLNTHNNDVIDSVIKNINDALKAFSDSDAKPYEISMTIGYTKVDLANYDMDQLMDETYKRMYENKQK